MRPDKVFHIISNTHWDREWRYTFQRNRQMLVEMIDSVIDILMNNPEYRAFHFDSQTVLIDDYLEIKPQNKDIIRNLLLDKRIFIGPWFILPDEFQVGGENLIRNLLLGHKKAKEFGRISKTGYSPFSWGQISQLPQIYAGFGINVIMFYRGVNAIESPFAEFMWEGADGTKALASRFSTMPRYNFYFYVYRRAVHNEDIPDVEFNPDNDDNLFHLADTGIKEDYFNINPADKYCPEKIKSAVEQLINDQADDFTTPHVIWMEGHDSSGPNQKTTGIIKDIKKEFPSINIIHSTLEEYSELLKSTADFDKLPLVKGERRSSQFNLRSGNLYGYTISARMYLKQKNFEAEKHLQYYAEPFNSAAAILGMGSDNQYLEKAWTHLIQNSAHDSIGGCSLDTVHKDMIWRYKQCIEISNGVLNTAYKYIVSKIKTPDVKDHNLNLVAFNPLPFSRDKIKEVIIDIPAKYDKGGLSLYNPNRQKLSLTVLERKHEQPVFEQLTDRPMYLDMIRYKCLVFFKDMPAFGYKSFSIVSAKPKKEKEKKLAGIKKKLPVLENKYLRISVNKNGTINIFNKEDNLEILNTGYFYDEGEAGHAWVHKPVTPYITTLKSRPVIKIIENNALREVCLINFNFSLPAGLTERKKKKGKYIKQEILCFIKLCKDSKRIDYTIKLNNKTESHRLRIMFPTGIYSDFSYGEGQFDVVKRSTGRPDTSSWVEQPMYDFPMHHFVDLSDGQKGAAVLVEGLKEYEILPDKQTIAVTLIRGFEYVIQPSSLERYPDMKGSQCLGEHTFNLSFYPHKGNWVDGKVFKEATDFNYDVNAVQTINGNGEMPLCASFIKIGNSDVVMSCFKRSEDLAGYILRLFNPTPSVIQTTVTTFFRINKAEVVTLEEIKLADADVSEHSQINIKIPAKKILTLKLSFNS